MTDKDDLREIQHRVMFQDLYSRMENVEVKAEDMDNLLTLSKVLTFRGSSTNADLARIVDTAKAGDVYNLLDDGDVGKTGDNVVWTGEEWDLFGTSVSLSGYATESYADTVADTAVTTAKEYTDSAISSAASSNPQHNITVSASDPSGGSNGDIWFKVA